MNSTHEDAVLNFDLDFLHPASNNIPLPVQKLKYITQLKRRIIRVDALQNHTNTINQELANKSKELEEAKRKLDSTTQEYRQTSLDYKEALESSEKCERENVKLRVTIKKLDEERFKAVNDYEAIKSHVAQLEQLIKQQDRKLESLDKLDKKKTDKFIEEKVNAKTKDNEKEILLWKKKFEALQKEIQDLKCVNAKLNEEVLRQCDKLGSKVEPVSPDHSDIEDDMSMGDTTTVGNQDLSRTNADRAQNCPAANREITHMELDNDCNNEIVSVDLGYGSSLASSDNEKWINSPDYVFSPINTESIENHRSRRLVTAATSPIQWLEEIELANSPVLLKKTMDVATSPVFVERTKEMATSPVFFGKMRNVATSPAFLVKMIDIAVSPKTVQFETLNDSLIKTESNVVIEITPSPTLETTSSTNAQAEELNSPVLNVITDITPNPVKILETTSAPNILVNTNNIQKIISRAEELNSPVPKLVIEVTSSPVKTLDTISPTVAQVNTNNIQKVVSKAEELNSPVPNVVIESTPSPVKTLESTSPTNTKVNTNNIQKVESRLEKLFGAIPYEEDEELFGTILNSNLQGTNIDATQEMQEKECLEINNSKNMDVDSSTDNEIEMILNVMRLNHNIITPIPKTPGKTSRQSISTHSYDTPCAVDTKHSTCLDAAIARAHAATAREEAASARKDAAKTREDNGKLRTTLNKLMIEMSSIKNFLKSQMSMPDTLLEPNHDSSPTTDLFINDNSVNVRHGYSNKIGSDQFNKTSLELNSNMPPAIPTGPPDKEITIISEEIIRPAYFHISVKKQDKHEILQTPRMELENSFEQSVVCTETDNGNVNNGEIIEMKSPTKDVADKKVKRCKKLTNLAKYRKKCESRKYKIKSEAPLVKPITKPKQVRLTKHITERDTSATLNDTQVYAKAVKVMAELNAKTKEKKQSEEPQSDANMTTQEEINAAKSQNSDILCQENETSSLRSHSSNSNATTALLKSPVMVKEPVVILPRCAIKSLDETGVLLNSASSSRKRSITSPELPVISESSVVAFKCLVKSSETNVQLLDKTCENVNVAIEPVKHAKQSPITSPYHSRSPDSPVAVKESVSIKSKLFVTSPEITDSSLKTTVTLPRRSNRFSDIKNMAAANLKLFVKPSEVMAPTPKLGISSPKRSIKSPEVSVSLMDSPEMSCMKPVNTSARLSVETPVLPVVLTESTPLKHFAKSPVSPLKPLTKSASLLPITSRCIRSPEYSGVSRELAIISTKYSAKTSDTTVSCQKNANTSPGFTFPNRSISTDGSSRLTAIMSPERVITSPGLPIAFSNQNNTLIPATPSKPLSTIPVCGITSPKLANMSPNYTVSSPLSSRITRSRSKLENDLPEELLHRNSKLQNILQNRHPAIHNTIKENRLVSEQPISQMKRKRTVSNSSESQNKKIPNNKLMNTEVNTPTVEHISSWDAKESVLCVMIQKYGQKTVKQSTKSVPAHVLNKISETIEKYTLKTKAPSSNESSIMNELVAELQEYDYKSLVPGIIHYLINPQRKMELFGKSSPRPHAPPMTRSEQVMLYILKQMRHYWPSVDIVDSVLSTIEHTLFKLNQTPEFDVIESVSHCYALVCRYFGMKSRLIVYMLDAMYCIQFKSIPLIRQCLEVWPHSIPLAHMSVAKTPLVTCFVYLLHFYKCEDRFNRLQDIRILLNRTYFYEFTEWNEKKILDLFKTAIAEIKDIAIEKKMLRIALILLGKRNGPRWTQNNVYKKILQPLIDNERVPNHRKAFCLSLIGPLMKPYPADMTANCECAMNQFTDILKTTTSSEIREAIISSLVIMNRHNQRSVNEVLLKQKIWPMSAELEDILCYYVRMKPRHAWLKILPNIPVFENI